MLSVSLKSLRENSGFTQQQVAELLNIDRSTYAYYEIGKTTPNLNTLRKLARIFNVSYDVLIDGSSRVILSDNTIQYKTTNLSDEKIYALSEEEKKLITLFRLCSLDEQKKLIDSLNEKIESSK